MPAALKASMDLYETGVFKLRNGVGNVVFTQSGSGRDLIDRNHGIGEQAGLAVGHQKFGDRNDSPRPSGQSVRNALEVTGPGTESRLQADPINVGGQALEVFVRARSELGGQLRGEEWRQARHFDAAAKNDELRDARNPANEGGVDLSIDPRLRHGRRREHNDKMGAVSEPLFHLLPQAIAGSDFPIVEPDIDPLLHEAMGERSND